MDKFIKPRKMDCRFNLFPFSPLDMRPPKLVDLMESIVNYDRPVEDRIKLSQLSLYARNTIFNFDYVLTDKISKEDFEKNILNHFIDRRIGFETLSLFRIKLEVKINEIMPIYNKMFDFIDGWNLFNDGETIDRTLIEEKAGTSNSLSNNTTETSSSSSTTNDNRSSDTPQNQLEDVRDGIYVDKYSYVQNSGEDGSSSSGSSENLQETTDNNNVTEHITHSPANKLEIYQKFMQDKNNIYSLIFKDLEELFYQLAD